MLSMLTLTRPRGLRACLPRRRAGGRALAARSASRKQNWPRSSTPALLHDIGKLAIPEAILRKPAPLTAEEQALVRCHPTLATELIGRRARTSARRPTRPRCPRAHGRTGFSEGDSRCRCRRWARASSRCRCLRHHDPAARLPRRDRPPGRRCSKWSAAAGTQFDPVVVSAFRRVLDAL